MQISKAFPQGAFPRSPGGGAPEYAEQLQRERLRHQRIQRLRTLQVWCYPILLAVFGAVVAVILGQYVFDQTKIVLGALILVPFLLVLIKRHEFGFLIFAASVTPFVPTALKVGTLYVSPAIPILLLLAFLVLLRKAFRVADTLPPSIWTTWPLIGLILMAIVSEVMGQVTWLYGVPHEVLGNPIIFEEIIGIAIYCVPLLIVWIASGVLTHKDEWIGYIQHTFMVLALLDAAVIIVEYKHIGADLYAFRYTSPSIGWMPLEAMAQLLVLGCLIAYVRFLYSTHWKMRVLYGAAALITLLALYFSLENSWWIEGIVGLAVITLFYSRKIFAILCVAVLPLIPVIHSFLQKLATVKSVDALRLIIWKDILRAWSKRPILGVGPGNLWAYDQTFSQLPQGVRDFAKSGFGVAHEGYLQTLGELGPLGLFCQVAFIVIMIIASVRLYRRSRAASTQEERQNCILGLIGLGLVCGSSAGDFVAAYFFLPPRQSMHVASLPQAMAAWVIYGCVLYKDQIWRLARRGAGVQA